MNRRDQQRHDTHAAILAAARESLRAHGLAGSSVAEVMKRAGLTVGGFYAHFDNKEALMAETLRATLRQMWQRLLSDVTDTDGASRGYHVLRRYLSTRHRDAVHDGCPLPATAAEIAQHPEPYRGVLTAEVRAFIAELEPMLAGPAETRRTRALGLFCLMFGALSLSRATRGTALSGELLSAASEFGRTALGARPYRGGKNRG